MNAPGSLFFFCFVGDVFHVDNLLNEHDFILHPSIFLFTCFTFMK
jgi:hypothetical protein